MRTQVGIIGAGPAGLMLARLLQLAGIESIVIESRDRDYCESRIRAGLIEQWAHDMLVEVGVGERMQREGLFHRGIKWNFAGTLHPIDFVDLVGKGVVIYGQQEIVKDMIGHRLGTGQPILFEVGDVSVHDIDTKRPKIRFRHEGKDQEIDCDFIGGCDGFHGICRPSIPDGVLTTYDREYPFGWLGILSESPPPDHELIYSYHDRGFALFTMRSPTLARLYFQCAPDEDIDRWPDDKIWEELHARLGGVRKLQEGKIVQKGVTAMRSFVVEPMQFGRLFLAGDSAHIVPPTGAKGMNLALADVRMLARAIAEFYHSGNTEQLDGYSKKVLPRVWKAQRFSWWMTQMLHHFPHENAFDRRRQLAELDYLVGSRAAMTTLAENYAGLPID
ncbi:MAG TPA: 4-hydroxybenzoate 3-monooxygenase [Pseudolabrys sp.]|jgi:p-hydroxybenzoate 3-monooxygenase|nr:4-hydroxybenzoate 3-monooxygenase [Pseudolabrys sp.]